MYLNIFDQKLYFSNFSLMKKKDFDISILQDSIKNQLDNFETYKLNGSDISVDILNYYLNFFSFEFPTEKHLIVILEDIDLLSTICQNKLLKFIEDISPNFYILAFYVDSEKILNTIKSRGIKIDHSNKAHNPSQEEELAENFYKFLQQKDYFSLAQLLDDILDSKTNQEIFLEAMEKKLTNNENSEIKIGSFLYSWIDVVQSNANVKLKKQQLLMDFLD